MYPDAIDCIVVAAAVVAVAGTVAGHLTFPYGAVVDHYCAFDTDVAPSDAFDVSVVAVAVVVVVAAAVDGDGDVNSLWECQIPRHRMKVCGKCGHSCCNGGRAVRCTVEPIATRPGWTRSACKCTDRTCLRRILRCHRCN